MKTLFTLLACAAACTGAWGQSIALTGVLGDKALLVVAGSTPKWVAVGESYHEIKVLSVSSDQAVLDLRGQRFTRRVGDAQVSVAGNPPKLDGKTISLQADTGGHFTTAGRINKEAVQFTVDTGATAIAMSETEAERLGLKYKTGEPLRAATANGMVNGWRITLASVTIGDVVVYEVEAAVLPTVMPFVLLGNSFLSRFQMRQENGQMTLVKRF